MARKWNLSCNSFSSSFQLEFWRHGGVWNRGVGRSRSVGTMVWLKFASQDFQCRRINLYPSCYVTLKIERRIGERTKFTWCSRVVGKKTSPVQPGPALNPFHTTNFLPREAWQFFTRIQLKLLKQYWDGNSGTINIHRLRRDIYGHPFCI